jgi:glycosyltransferase involved in cell wall biosynthesis
MKRFTSTEIKDFVSKANLDEKIILGKDPSWPKISVVTPSYNQSQFLEKTILSVLNQNYPNLEYIIIDGGSTDGSIEIIKKYEKYLTYWVTEKDNGMYDAINKGLKIASGDILAYLNSDDVYYPNTMNIIVDYFVKHPETSLVYGNCDFIDWEGNFLYTYRFPKFNWHRFIVLNWSSIPQQTTFWRRGVHDEIGYFDPILKMAGDFDFYAKIGKISHVEHIGKTLAQYRLHGKSLSSTRKNINRDEVCRIHQQHGISDGFTSMCLRCIAEGYIKLLNLSLVIRKLLRLL